jgi:hypothetical protein
MTALPILAKLRQHGILVQELAEPVDLDVEAYVVLETEKTTSPDICTGIERFETVLSVRKERRQMRFEAGTLVVPTAQRLGNLLVYLLEPESDDGLARWEFFDPYIHVGGLFPVYRVASSERRSLRQRLRTRAGLSPELRTRNSPLPARA